MNMPANFPVKVLRPSDPAWDRRTTCGACGRSWDDSVSTGMTPAPGGRCPFEHFHDDAPTYRILSIDAWRDDGGWQWNNWHNVGDVPRAWVGMDARALFAAMRDAGYLARNSAGKVAREDDGYNVVIMARGTREPLYAIEYGSADA